MRVGGFLSVVFHAAIVAGGLIVAPALKSEPTPMIMMPVELLTIAESTNIAPVSEQAKPDDEALEAMEIEDIPPPAAAPPPPPEEEFVPEAETPPPPKKNDSKKSESRQKEESFEDALQGILANVDKTPPKQQRAAAAEKAANLRTVEDAAQRKGVGDNKRMTMTVTDAIRSQLISKRCWNDQDDMADAPRLRATIRVRFGRDGHFLSSPQLMEPSREPSNDPPLQVFIQRARNALLKCNNLGFQVPQEYFDIQPAQYIDITFLP